MSEAGLIEGWPACDPATVAPIRNGSPDMYNHRPTRFVSYNEAKGRGWRFFWTGERCNKYGHRAAHYTSNPSVCTDCRKIEGGGLPTYSKGIPQLDDPNNHARAYSPRARTVGVDSAIPRLAEQLFLTKYAELKDWDKAAEACQRPPFEFLAILSWNEAFRKAVNALEDELKIARTTGVSEDFEWDEAKRNVLLIVYMNTADMVQAQRSIGCTNVQFHRELEENPAFAERWESAQPIAAKVFDYKAGSLAVAGDSQILRRLTANLFPEKYGENLKMDLKVTRQLSPEMLNEQLTQALGRLDRAGLLTHRDPAIIDAEFSVREDGRQTESLGIGEPEADVDGSDSNSDLVS
jgi:hypothetical protein